MDFLELYPALLTTRELAAPGGTVRAESMLDRSTDGTKCEAPQYVF